MAWGREGRIKKMIAFTPVQLQGGSKKYMWSVAVVAPITEIEGSIHRIQIRQFILEGFVVIIILSGGLFIIGMMVRWSGDIIFTLNRDGYITSINQAGCSFFKKAREEIIGQNIGEICFNEESAFVQYRAIDETFSSRLSKQLTYPVNINGNEYWLSTNFSGLLDEKGDVYSVLGIARDITERVKMQEQMFHTEKLASMGTLAAGVAHEINNPLSIILGFTDLLLEKVPADPELQDILKSIESQGIKAKRVVENLLTFARYKGHVEEDVDIN
jgi:PAS domain S-box-containing protein